MRAGPRLVPRQTVDARLDASREERFLAGRGDHGTGQNQVLDHVNAHLRLGFLPRTRLELDLGNHDLVHADDQVAQEAARETTQYRLALGYDLSRRVLVEGTYERMTSDGGSEANQEIVGVAFDYGGTGLPATLRLSYTFDDFEDPQRLDSSYQAQVVSLSGSFDF